MNIGKQIRYYRIRKSVRQEDLADHLSVSCQAVSKWETEASLPDITLLPKIAVYLGVSIDDLFRISEEEQLERIENTLEAGGCPDECSFRTYEEFLEPLTRREEYRLRAHAMLAQLYNARAYRDHQEAIRHARTAVEMDPDLIHTDAWPALIEAHQGHCGDEWFDNHFTLIRFLQDYLERHPGHFRCLYALCENLLADRRYEEAEPYVNMIEAMPGRAHMAEVYRGDIAQGRGDMPAALMHWNKSVEEHPEVWQAWDDRAARLKKLGRYEDALRDYEQCFTMQTPPRISDGLYARAQLFEQLDRYPEAIRERERIIECLSREYGLTEGEIVEEQRREIRRLSALLESK